MNKFFLNFGHYKYMNFTDMKRFLLTIVLFLVAINASQAQALPENISQGCELPRMRTLPYNTNELAQRYGTEAVSSLYLRPIANWQQTEDEEAFIFSASYIVPFTWLSRQALLYVEGASGAYEVLINGKVAGSTFNGFTPTEFNITKKSKEESNTISIRIYKSHWSQRLHNADTTKAYLGEVYVMSQPTIRVRNIVHNATLDATGEMANIEVGIVVKTESLNAKKARIHYELVAADTTVATYGYRDITLQMRGEDTIKFMTRIPRSEMWSANKPTRYRLNLTTQIEGRKVEFQSHWVGLRSAELKAGKLMINGEAVALSATECNPQTITAEAIATAKQKGHNAVKFSSYAVPQHAYNMCDSLGMYVVMQVPINTSASGSSRRIGGNESNNPAWGEAFLSLSEAAWHSTCGFACVVAYSLAEESANGINLYESYLRLKELEQKRPIIYPDAGSEWNNDGGF